MSELLGPVPKETEAVEVSKEELALATDVILAMIKTSKGFKMYLPNNPLLARFNEDLTSKMRKHLSLYGDYRLEIDQFELRYRGKTIYENKDPKESMAFKMYSDGVRFLIFSDGMQEYELFEFLEIVGKERPGEVDDDIVTLLWEKDLPNVTYILAEDFLEFDWAGAGASTPQSQQEKIKGIYQSISANDTPLATPMLIPQNILTITAEEAEWLQKARQAEESRKPLDEVVQIVLAVLAGETDPEMFSEFLGIMVKLAEDLAASGEAKYTFTLIRFLGNLAKNDATAPDASAAITQALAGLFSEKTLEAFIRILDDTELVSPEELLEILQLLGKPCLGRICELLSLVQKMKMRKVIIQALIDIGHDAPEVFFPLLSDPRWYVARNMVFILNRIGSRGALDHVVQLITHKEPGVRREVLNYLERNPDPKAKNCILRFLRDDSSAIRVRALQVLVATRGTFALKPIAAIAASEQFAEKDIAEKKAVFEALGELGADEMIPMFREMLMKRYWFNKAKEKEAVTCAVSGLMRIRSEAAVKVLEEASSVKSDDTRGFIIQAIETLAAESMKKVTQP